MNDNLLTWKEQDDNGKQTGRWLTVGGFEFVPLQYADLVAIKPAEDVTIPMALRRAKVIDGNIEELLPGVTASVTATLNSRFSSRAFALVEGGWLPSGLALSGETIALLDRCTVTAIKSRFVGGLKKNEDDNDFLDFFDRPGIRINPLLYALEGNHRTNPTAAEIQDLFEEAAEALRKALPNAQLVPSDNEGLQGAVAIAQSTEASFEKKQAFLMRLVPKLHAPTSGKRRADLWEEILGAARDCNIPKRSLVVIAALSSILVPHGKSPAKRLLKLRPNYTSEDAYNALSDLRAIEMLKRF